MSKLIIYLSIPLLTGGIIALTNHPVSNKYINRLSMFILRLKEKNVPKSNWWSRFFNRPLLWLLSGVINGSKKVKHEGLKNGIRLTLFIYISLIWVSLIVALAFFTIQLIIIGIALYIVYLFLVSWGVISSDEKDVAGRKRTLGIPDKNQRINADSGKIEEEGLFGYSKTNRRINPKTGKIQEKGIFGWEDTNTTIDQQSGEVQRESFLGKEEAKTRIHPKTGVIQEKGLLGWTDTDFRVDPKTGKRQKKGLFGWTDV